MPNDPNVAGAISDLVMSIIVLLALIASLAGNVYQYMTIGRLRDRLAWRNRSWNMAPTPDADRNTFNTTHDREVRE